MKKRALRKLKSRSGETLAETLVSVLISALALVMLAGAIGAAKNIIANSDKKMDEYYHGISRMGQTETTGGTPGEGTGGPSDGVVTIKTDEGTAIGIDGTEDVAVKYQEISVFANMPVVAYWVSQEVTGP